MNVEYMSRDQLIAEVLSHGDDDFEMTRFVVERSPIGTIWREPRSRAPVTTRYARRPSTHSKAQHILATLGEGLHEDD
jgi:hypothetical protein